MIDAWITENPYPILLLSPQKANNTLLCLIAPGSMRFRDRKQAGQLLAQQLAAYNKNAIVLAIPRGGIPVGYEIATNIKCPLSIIGVRKIGSPWNPEYALGAVAENQTTILDNDYIEHQKIPPTVIQSIVRTEKEELKRRVQLYRKGQPLPKLQNKTAIIVDDGLATGYTAKAAILSVLKHHPKSIIFSAPVCSADSLQALLTVVDNIVCLVTPADLESIGEWYEHFGNVSDEDAQSLLEKNTAHLYKNK